MFVTAKEGGAAYAAPDSVVSEAAIQADFGALGEIVVVFHPSGKSRTARSTCGGKPVSFDSGYYEGTITFHGEEAYASADATRANGDIDFLLNSVCPGSSGVVGGSSLSGAQLNAYGAVSDDRAHLSVVKNRPSAPAHFEADVSEAHDGVSITRFIHTVAPAGSFEFDSKAQTATVHPAAPFAGTGHYQRSARLMNLWTGDLTVDFPGRSGVKLTGSGAHANLSHAMRSWYNRR